MDNRTTDFHFKIQLVHSAPPGCEHLSNGLLLVTWVMHDGTPHATPSRRPHNEVPGALNSSRNCLIP